jgi:hypothetical protein
MIITIKSFDQITEISFNMHFWLTDFNAQNVSLRVATSVDIAILKACCRALSFTFLHSCWLNPSPLLFKSLLPGQEDCVFFSGHLNLHEKPEPGIPYREKYYNN